MCTGELDFSHFSHLTSEKIATKISADTFPSIYVYENIMLWVLNIYAIFI